MSFFSLHDPQLKNPIFAQNEIGHYLISLFATVSFMPAKVPAKPATSSAK